MYEYSRGQYFCRMFKFTFISKNLVRTEPYMLNLLHLLHFRQIKIIKQRYRAITSTFVVVYFRVGNITGPAKASHYSEAEET